MQRSESAIGKVIDGYRILDLLGQGGMGIVYKAEDIALSRVVALKMIAPDLVSQETFLRRFQSEARALARVDSPYIVGIHALRKSGDHVFIVMEYVDGWTLSDEVNNSTLDTKRTIDILKQMLQAFSHAHGVGVVHRDIKPSNIMLTSSDRVKVTDFGLAKLRREDGMSTVTQGIAGTARYMSPEQVQGKKIDHRSDIYSLGMTMYHMLAGKLPFEPEEGTYSILRRVVEEEFPPVASINPAVPAALSTVIQRAIEKNPDDRYQSADEMLAAVEAMFQQNEKPVEQTMPFRPAPKASRKIPPRLVAVIAVGVLLLLPIYYFVSRALETPQGEEPEVTLQQPVSVPDDTTEQVAQPMLAQLTVRSSPENAQVFAGDRLLGTTPLEAHELAPGDVELRIVLDGYQTQARSITLEPGDATETFTLQREQMVSRDPVPPPNDPVDTNPIDPEPAIVMGTMNLQAEPAGIIYVNGERLGNQATSQFPVGEYTLRFEDPANPEMACERTVTLNRGNPVNLTCYFEHKLTIVTDTENGGNPPYAYLYINGEDFDSTPLADYSVPSGTYNIEVRRFEYEIENPQRTVVLRPVFDKEQTAHVETFLIKPR